MFYAPHKSLLTVLVDRYVSIGEGKSALLATILEEIISCYQITVEGFCNYSMESDLKIISVKLVSYVT